MKNNAPKLLTNDRPFEVVDSPHYRKCNLRRDSKELQFEIRVSDYVRFTDSGFVYDGTVRDINAVGIQLNYPDRFFPFSSMKYLEVKNNLKFQRRPNTTGDVHSSISPVLILTGLLM